jgi:hypothetical protein
VSELLAQRPWTATRPDAVLGFTPLPPAPRRPGQRRHLTLRGEAAYLLGVDCDTCAFLFERLGGANQTVAVPELAERLRRGLTALDDEVLGAFDGVLPRGGYRVSLLRARPERVALGSAGDYFVDEQPALWGLDGFWGLPHHPKAAYYRSLTRALGVGDGLFEFVVPMVPPTWLDEDRVAWYARRLAEGEAPTAVALTLLDVKAPAVWAGEPAVTRHWCLAHYLLDGHHKALAASQTGHALTLLSFLAVEESQASPEEIGRCLDELRAGASP